MNQLSNVGYSSVFESVKKVNDNGVEYWLARDFQTILQYSSWDKFLNVVEKAKEACRNSGHNPADHFSHMVKMVSIGSGAQRETEDIKLSRYACYLIIQNADPAKEIVALGQTYFAVQTRRQELSDEFGKFESDEEKRLFLRQQMKEHNRHLASQRIKRRALSSRLTRPYFRIMVIRGFMAGWARLISIGAKALKKGRKFLIIWVVRSWRQIYFARLKRKISCVGRI